MIFPVAAVSFSPCGSLPIFAVNASAILPWPALLARASLFEHFSVQLQRFATFWGTVTLL